MINKTTFILILTYKAKLILKCRKNTKNPIGLNSVLIKRSIMIIFIYFLKKKIFNVIREAEFFVIQYSLALMNFWTVFFQQIEIF